MKNNISKKVKGNQKSIFSLPNTKQNYILILKQAQYFKDNIYTIKQIKNLRLFFHNNKKWKYIIINYFVSTNRIDMSLLKKYEINSLYKIEDYSEFIKDINQIYDIENQKINLNVKINENIACAYCKSNIVEHDDLLKHLFYCKTYEYTLFGEEIPKHLKPCKSKECENFRYTLFGEPVPKEILKRQKKRLPPPHKVKEPRDYKTDPAFVLYIEMKKMKNLKKAFINELKNIVKKNQAERQVIYIASTTEMQNLNYFKVGGVKTESNLKARLSQYNIGTVKGLNDYKFLFTYLLPKPIPFYQIENELKVKLKKNRIGNTEVYQYPLHSLRSQIENLINDIKA